MKKILTTLLLAIVFSAGAFADGEPKNNVEKISKDVLRDFAYQFYNATNVSWKIDGAYQKAVFILNGKSTCAMYDNQGYFLMASEQVTADELPQTIKQNIDQNFSGYEIKDAVKVIARPSDYANDDDTGSYWTALKGEKEILYVLISPEKTAKVVRRVGVSK